MIAVFSNLCQFIRTKYSGISGIMYWLVSLPYFGAEMVRSNVIARQSTQQNASTHNAKAAAKLKWMEQVWRELCEEEEKKFKNKK